VSPRAFVQQARIDEDVAAKFEAINVFRTVLRSGAGVSPSSSVRRVLRARLNRMFTASSVLFMAAAISLLESPPSTWRRSGSR